MELKEIKCDDMDWIHLVQDNNHGNQTSNSIKRGELLTSLATISIPRRALLHTVSKLDFISSSLSNEHRRTV
jgi:hypothetical protein